MNRGATLALAVGLPAATLLAACAGGPSVSMKDADRAAIKTVWVKPDVAMPDAFSYQARGAGMGAVFGLIGALVEVSTSKPANEGQALRQAAIGSGTTVQALVREAFTKEANALGAMRFTQDAAEAADATVALQVNVYGFGRTHLLGELLHPTFNVTATMQRLDGTVVWKRTEFITPMNNDNQTGYKFETLLGDPAQLAVAYRQGASIVTRYLAQGLPRR